jgi:hypothetical protein
MGRGPGQLHKPRGRKTTLDIDEPHAVKIAEPRELE